MSRIIRILSFIPLALEVRFNKLRSIVSYRESDIYIFSFLLCSPLSWVIIEVSRSVGLSVGVDVNWLYLGGNTSFGN
jgi:hypothetical protein